MSWGERSCKPPCRSTDQVTPLICNVDCPGYEWDGKTKPDSISAKANDLVLMALGPAARFLKKIQYRSTGEKDEKQNKRV